MNYKFVGNYSEKSKKQFRLAQESDLAKIAEFLSTNSPRLNNISFEIFNTKEGKQKADPLKSISRASARYDGFTVYRVWDTTDDPHFPHEITHLVAHTWAKPYLWTTELDTAKGKTIRKEIEMVSTSFVQEGLAISIDEMVFNRKLYEHGERKYPDIWCKENKKGFPDLKEVISFEGFCSFDNRVVVPFSASLSKYLLNKFGIDKYKKMYIGLKETYSPMKNVKTIERVYGLSEDQMVNNWKKSIGII